MAKRPLVQEYAWTVFKPKDATQQKKADKTADYVLLTDYEPSGSGVFTSDKWLYYVIYGLIDSEEAEVGDLVKIDTDYYLIIAPLTYKKITAVMPKEEKQ